MAYLKVFSHHFSGEAKANHKTSVKPVKSLGEIL